ncbi:uncharacterized protein L201_001790 [Kwoniella dendrophila CBS 6074]|uniref:Mob1/phocein n=1 Tax=Kwoniella dendrophila CBS 6074 TaxID=1295534 RepID=A0AAX4JNC0_9TREE
MIIPPQSESSTKGKNSIYRLKRGTKLSDLPPLPPNPPVPDLSSLNGPFQLAEFLSLKVRHDPHDVQSLVEIPIGDKSLGGKAPDRSVWIYEHLRRIPIDLTPLVTALLPICNRETCPEMKAHEWLYLCSAHGGGAESCSAIDYILHTLDSTTALLNSSLNFPSRMQIPPSSVSHFPSLFRRLSRIFSHAYFHHREIFQLSENETSLYSRFLGLCEKYELVGQSLLPIPRDVIVNSSHHQSEEEEEEKQDSSDEEEQEDNDDDEEEVDETRGRKDDNSNAAQSNTVSPIKEKRTQSLDRSLPPSTTTTITTSPTTTKNSVSSSSSPLKEKIIPPPGPQRSDTLRPDSISPENGFGTIRENDNDASKDSMISTLLPKSPANIDKNRKKHTLSRGKQPRATMHWGGSSEDNNNPIPDLPTTSSFNKSNTTSGSVTEEKDSSLPVKNRDRSESIESAIHIPSEIEAELPEELKEENLENIPISDPIDENTGSATNDLEGSEDIEQKEVNEEEEEEVEVTPKDEIELLEEKGELKPETSVAPLSPPSLISTSKPTTTKSSNENDQEQGKSDNDIVISTKEEDPVSLKGDSAEAKEQDQNTKDEQKSGVKTETEDRPEEKKEEITTDSQTKSSKSKKKSKKATSSSSSSSLQSSTSSPMNISTSTSNLLSNNSPIPSPIKGKGKLVPAEISNSTNSFINDDNLEKEKKKDDLSSSSSALDVKDKTEEK